MNVNITSFSIVCFWLFMEVMGPIEKMFREKFFELYSIDFERVKGPQRVCGESL